MSAIDRASEFMRDRFNGRLLRVVKATKRRRGDFHSDRREDDGELQLWFIEQDGVKANAVVHIFGDGEAFDVYIQTTSENSLDATERGMRDVLKRHHLSPVVVH